MVPKLRNVGQKESYSVSMMMDCVGLAHFTNFNGHLDSLNEYIAQVPIRHNVISAIILAGIIQGILLSLVVISKPGKQNAPVRVLSIYVLVLLFPMIDHYLCYTGLMTRVLHLNDSSEAFVLLIGPGLYFLTRSIIYRSGITLFQDWKHLIIPISYFLSQIGYFIAGRDVKLTAYLTGFHSNLDRPSIDVGPFLQFSEGIKDYLHYVVLFSLAFYLILSARLIFKNRDRFKNFFQFGSSADRFVFSKYMIISYALVALVVFITLVKNDGDEGEQYVFLGITLSYFMMSYFVMRESHFLTPSWAADKYETSGLSEPTEALLKKISDALNHQAYYLHPECTLSDLAKKLLVHPNYISQAINQEYGQKFRDHINSRRVREAQSRLSNQEYAKYTISSIGESVGFNSNSAFYAAFKKHVGVTPTIFQEQQKKAESK